MNVCALSLNLDLMDSLIFRNVFPSIKLFFLNFDSAYKCDDKKSVSKQKETRYESVVVDSKDVLSLQIKLKRS